MLKLAPLLLVAFSVFHTFAQDLKFDIGPKIEKSPSGNVSFFNTTSKKAYTLYPLNKKNIEISSIDNYTTYSGTVKSLSAEIAAEKQQATLENIFDFDGKNYILYSTYYKERNEQVLYVQELSDAMVMLGSPVRVSSFLGVDGPKDVTVSKSPVDKYILLTKRKRGGIDCRVLNTSFKELYAKEFEIKSKSSLFSLTSLKIDDQGNIFILGYSNSSKPKDPFLLIYSMDKKNTLVKNFTEEGEENFGFNINWINKDNAVIAGLYSKGKEIGYRCYRFNASTNTIEMLAAEAFSDEYQAITKRGYKPEFFGVEDVVVLENGNIVVAIEGNVKQNLQYGSNAQYFSSPVQVITLNPEGKKQWDRIIYKYQIQSFSSDLIGHRFFYRGNKVYLVYNDHLANFNIAPHENKQKAWLLKKAMYVATTEIDENGNVKKLKLITTTVKEESYFIFPTVAQIEPNLFHFTLRTSKGDFYATLIAND